MILSLEKSNGISATALKYYAIIAMVIDHVAWAFVPTSSVLGQAMHIIGRTVAPILCYFIAEGYYHTKNVKKYALRLAVFALISHCPFVFFELGMPFSNQPFTGVIYTLFLGLIALMCWNKIENKTLKIIVIIGICILSIPGDWNYFGVLWILFFGIYHGNFKKQMISFSVISVLMALDIGIFPAIINHLPIQWNLFQFGALLAIPILLLYNGKRGKGGNFSKWIFYIFYPLHLVILGILRFYVFK